MIWIQTLLLLLLLLGVSLSEPHIDGKYGAAWAMYVYVHQCCECIWWNMIVNVASISESRRQRQLERRRQRERESHQLETLQQREERLLRRRARDRVRHANESAEQSGDIRLSHTKSHLGFWTHPNWCGRADDQDFMTITLTERNTWK